MAKPPLLFIHGMWSRPQVWARFEAHFQALGHETRAVSLPKDNLPALGLAEYAAAAIAQAEGLERPIVIGHSMGGLLAQIVAARIPARGLAALSPAPAAGILSMAPQPFKTLWPVLSRWGWWREETQPEAASALWGVFNGVPEAEAQAEIAALVLDSGKALFQIALPWLDSSGASKVDYAKLAMPTLVAAGTEDRITPVDTARAAARRLPGPVNYRELEGFGHWIIGEQAGPRVMAWIEDLIAKTAQ